MKSGRVIISGDNCEFTTENSIPFDSVLVQVNEINSEYIIRAEKQECFWFVVKDHVGEDGTKGFKLSKDDVLKIGRIRLKVKEINLKGHESTINLLEEEKLSENSACRFCLGDSYKESNPLITPCKCDGSMK